MTPEVLAELERLAWDRYLDTRTARSFESWQRLWRMRKAAGLLIPEGAW